MRGHLIASAGGKFNSVTAFLSLVAAAMIFAGVTIAPKYIDNFGLRQDLYLQMVNAKNLTDQQIVGKVAALAAERSIPLTAEGIQCTRTPDNKQIHCEYSYRWPVTVQGRALFDMPFSEMIDRPITDVLK
jgi:hypothetical protein